MQTQAVWGIAVDSSARRVTLLAILSLLAHALFLSPLGALLGFLALSEPSIDDAPLLDPLTEIPISLQDGEPEGAGSPEPPAAIPAPEPAAAALPPDPAAPATPKPKPKPEPQKAQTQDAGAPKPPAPEKPKPKPADAGAGPGEVAGNKPPRIADPAAMVGSAAKLTDTKANVRLFIYSERIRGHLLGDRIGALFAALPQWQSFLGDGKVDLVRDVDVIYLAGPQFRRSDQIMALLDYNVPQAQMRAAIDTVVKRDTKGRWLESEFPAAIATADRAERLFALPRERLAIVSPLSAKDSVLQQGPKVQFPKPKAAEAVVVHIKTPWRVLLGTRLSLPKSIQSASLRVTPQGKGDVVIEILAQDESPEAAVESARTVSRTINEAAQLGGLGALLSGFGFAPLLDRIELQAKGKQIYGTLKVSASQLSRILEFVEGWAEATSGQRRTRPPAAAPTQAHDLGAPVLAPQAQAGTPGAAGAAVTGSTEAPKPLPPVTPPTPESVGGVEEAPPSGP